MVERITQGLESIEVCIIQKLGLTHMEESLEYFGERYSPKRPHYPNELRNSNK